jgi:hypothetical protein
MPQGKIRCEMTRNQKRSIGSTNRILEHMAADRKKAILAAGLVAVMAIMWVRLLTGKKPSSAGAAANSPTETTKETPPPVKVRLIELPEIQGRNDCISRDFFSVETVTGLRRGSTDQGTGTDTEVRSNTSRQTQEVIARVAQRLKLEAVSWSENPAAFINDQLRQVGDTLIVRDDTQAYTFEVLEIQEDSVLVGCNGEKLTLRLAQSHEVEN